MPSWWRPLKPPGHTGVNRPASGGSRRSGTQTGSGGNWRSGTAAGIGGSRRSGNWTGSGSTSAFATNDSTSGNGFVVVLQNGQPRLQRVQTGISDDLNVEIKSGLQQGDIIIVRQITSTNTGNSSSSRSGNEQRTFRFGGMPMMGPGGR